MPYKHDYDKALTRLTTILNRLYVGEELSVTLLAEEFNCSERTVQRDFNERLAHLYPIEKNGKKWRMQKGYKIEKDISFEEELILETLEQISGSIGKNFSKKAKKLIAKIKNQAESPIYAKIFMEDISTKLEIVSTLEDAIKNRFACCALYDFESYEKEIDIKPLKIVNFEGFWYVIAYDGRSDILKKYSLKNIKKVQKTEFTFEKNKDINRALENAVNIWFDPTKKEYEVKLLAEAEIAKYVKRKPIAPTQHILRSNSDGSIEISIYITDEMEIVSIIGYWMPFLKVIEPLWLKDLISQRAKGLI